ncbi:MAG TPA: hypothetical protein VI072_32265 [Polyangiaceae bacterium]
MSFLLALPVLGCGSAPEVQTEGTVDSTQQEVLVGSQLDCPLGAEHICVVRNMPYLLQTDDRVDVDVWDMRGVGCYDTSITTVLTTALANKTTARALRDRTLLWNNIQAGNNGGNPPLTSTKQYEQLTQQYRWAKAGQAGQNVQPFYFHEMLKDFYEGTTSTVNRYPANCNPDIYGSCHFNTSVLQNDLVGAAFRDFTDRTSHVTNDYVKGLMTSGFATMIAFSRYVPTATFDPSLGGFRVSFTWSSMHKVPVAAFGGSGTYSLRIHDVGNNVPYNVEVGTDMNLFGTIAGVSVANIKKFDFPNGKSKQTYVRYDPSVAPTSEVYFVDHVDALSLGLPTAGPMREVSNQSWASGSTTVMPFVQNQAPHLLVYNSATGAVRFDKIGANAQGVENKWSFNGWAGGFSHFTPYYINGNPYFVVYNKTTGEVHYDQFPSDLQGPIIHHTKFWPAGFTSITPFVSNGVNMLLLYNKTSGAVRFEALNSTGTNSSTTFSHTWGSGFTDFAAYDIAGEAYLTAYNSSTGLVHYDKVLGNGVQVLSQGNIGTGRSLHTLAYGGPPQLIAYAAGGSGIGEVLRLEMDGTVAAKTWGRTLFASGTSVVPFVQNKKSYVLVFNKANGAARTYELTLF